MKTLIALLVVGITFIDPVGLAPALLEPSAIPPTRSAGLVPVAEIDPLIVIDLRYATENNFSGQKVYQENVALLREETAHRLAAANAELVERGYRIKLWDAYRPSRLHYLLWELAGEKRYYFASPRYGSVHSRGAAVDVTMVDALGQEVEMPSDFDDFSGKAHRLAPMSAMARANLDLLTAAMRGNGFQALDFEWWHFEDTDWWRYPLLDLPLPGS